MTSTHNTPANGTDESVEIKKRSSKNGIQGLLKEGILREFSDPIDPEKFDQYRNKQEAFQKKIITHMKDIRREDSESWEWITDEEIDKEGKISAISEKVARMSKGLVMMRKRFLDRAIELFPRIKEQANWQSLLNKEIAIRDEKELQNYVNRTAIMRKLLLKIIPDLQANTSETKNFEAIFHDRDHYFDEEGKKRFSRIYRDYTHGQSPDRDDIDFILIAYQRAPSDRKKEVLSALWVVLSIKSAYDLWLIDDAFLENFAHEGMGDLYDGLERSQKDSFIRGLAQDETYVVGAKDFMEANFAQVFSNDRKRRKLAMEAARSVVMDMPEIEKHTTNDILGDIRKRKIQEAEANWEAEQNYDTYEEFVNELQIRLKNTGTIKNLHLLKTSGCVVRFRDPQNGIQHVRVNRVRNEDGSPIEAENGTTYGVELEWLVAVDGQIRENQNFVVSYEIFKDFLVQNKEVEVLRSEDFSTLLTDDLEKAWENGLIYDARAIDTEPANSNNIVSKLDLLDSEGRAFGFEKGTCFVAPSEDEAGKSQWDDVWMVKKISGDTIDLVDSHGYELEKNYPLPDFYNLVASTASFKRIAKISDDGDMLKELQEFGLDHHAKLKDGKIFMADSHGDDHEHSHEKEKEITCFESEDGGHIRIQFVQDGKVRFWEYSSETEVKKAREYAEKKGISEKELHGLYTWRTLSYPAFLKYLEKNKLKATNKDIIVPGAAHDHHGDHHHEHAHMTGSLFKRLLKWQNPASIWKGFEMIMHSIEHTLEKWAKLDAARFAMQTSRLLKLPDSVTAQVYSDIVNESKQIIEKYENKIFGLPGPAWRLKCIHIVHDKDSRPEEVMSAINYMLKSYGHFYAEDIKHYQSKVNPHNIATADPGYFAFLDGLILSSKLSGGLTSWRKKAYEKAIAEMGTEDDHEGEPTEEQLVHAILKMVDGKWEEYPYAASVVKASGGPSGFEKNWKFEGFDNAKKKGIEQTQMVNAQGRINKAIGYLKTHEIYKAVGAMEAVAQKTMAPKHQVMPFIWCVGGFSQYASHHALQKIKRYAEGGMSFHAYAFMREAKDNVVYTNTVRLALEDMWWKELVQEFDAKRSKLELDSHDPEKTDKAAKEMMEFWQTHCDRGLHDRLQWHNGWLLKKYQEWDTTAKQYLSILEWKHMMELNGSSIPSSDFAKGWYEEHGLRMSRIMTFDSKTGLYSFKRILNKIQLVGTRTWDKYMTDENYEKLWDGLKEQMNNLRDINAFWGDETLQRRQFLVYRKEIIDFFVRQLTSRTPIQTPEEIEAHLRKPHKYWKDLMDMWIEPRSIFDENIEASTVDSDFRNWKANLSSASKVDRVVNLERIIQGKSQSLVEKRPSKDTPKPKAWPRMKKEDWNKNDSAWHDEDEQYSGWANEAGDESGD